MIQQTTVPAEPCSAITVHTDGDRVLANDDGMATAEYAVATLAACAFAGLLLVIVRSDEVREALLGIITRALAIG